MKTRDILILAGLVILILGLTIAEKYAERRREQRREEAAIAERAVWQERMNKALEDRWRELSSQLRRTLDSMATDAVAGGVPRDSLAAVVMDSSFPAMITSNSDPATGQTVARTSEGPASDSLALVVLRAYDKGLVALPSDLTAYERRVAVNEVVSIVRARFGLSPSKFDSLLKAATSRP